MQRGTAEVNAGVSLAGDDTGALRQIVGTVEKTVGDLAGISTAAEQMAQASRAALSFRTGDDADSPAQPVAFSKPRLVDLSTGHAAAA